MLSNMLPMKLKGNTQCCEGIFKVNAIIKGEITHLKNLIIDNLGERTVNSYCKNAADKVTIAALGELEEYWAPSMKKTYKNVQVLVVQKDGEKAYVSIVGKESVCVDFGLFKYMISPGSNNGIVYYGQDGKGFLWKWIDQSEQNLEGNYNQHLQDIMEKMNIFSTFKLGRAKQIIMSNRTSRYRLITDTNSTIAMFFMQDDEEIEKKFTNVHSSIVIGEEETKKKKSAAFHLKFTSGIDAYFAKILFPEIAKRIDLLKKYVVLGNVSLLCS